MKILLTSLAVSMLAAPLLPAQSKAEKPNIIIILGDDVGWGDVGCYGATLIKTPHIDSLAKEGLRFTDAHASASVCTPTRYSLLTGEYSWRRKGAGLDKGVSNGDAPLLIPVESETLPGILKKSGYRTGAVGKWHLGFGTSKPDYNKPLTPGPLEIGFDEFFGFPATNDRVPTVYVRGHDVVGLDPADPIQYTYENPGKESPMKPFSAGRGRIGWISGGRAAWWKDETIADTFTREAVSFIEKNSGKPFFLYFAPHDCHAPTIPGPRFAGGTGISPRADMIQELDGSVGEILRTLDRLKLAENTLVVFSSDNGAHPVKEGEHRPNGILRGNKSQLWEGGHREPFIARWPGRIQPGVSSDLVCLVDLPATAAAIVGYPLPAKAAPDSFNLLPTLLGTPGHPVRDHLILMGGSGGLALRQGPLKYIPDLSTANGWAGKGKVSGEGLFNLADDPAETRNLRATRPEDSKRLADLLQRAVAAGSTRSMFH